MILKILNQLCGKGWVKEFKFHPTRKWRFDFANPTQKIAVELEGGIFIMGRHSRGKGMLADMEKYNEATIMGWRVLRYPPPKSSTGKMVDDIKKLISYSQCKGTGV